MLNAHKPVVGRDLHELRKKLGLTVVDFAFTLGITVNRYGLLVNKEADKPIRTASIALMARILDENPHLCIVPRIPNPAELYEKFKASMLPNLTRKEFAVLLGGEGSSGHRWITKGKTGTPANNRLALLLNELISDEKSLLKYEKTVQREGELRGIPDVWQTAKWKPVSGPSKRRAAT